MPWKVFLLLPVLLVVGAFGTALSVNRTDDLLPFLVAKSDHAKPLAWGSYLRAHRVALENLFWSGLPAKESPLPTIDLFVGDGVLDQMFRAKLTGSREVGRGPGGDRPYFSAYLVDESQKLQSAKIGLRGWGRFHHSPRKPSLRVKIRKDDVALGHRYVELQRPERVVGLTNYIPELLARRHGILTGLSDYTRLFINRKFKGVYMRSSRPGEPLTLALGRLPGPYFKGDALGSYQGADLWSGSKNWRVFETSARPLEHFDEGLRLIGLEKTPQNLERLRDYFDFEAFARWQALMIVVGSQHTDNFHNHLYFSDPLTGLIEPVVWDVNGLGGHLDVESVVDRVPNHIIDWMMRDPRWLHLRDEWIQKLIENDCDETNFRRTVDELWEKTGTDFSSDTFLAESVSTPFTGVSKIEPLPATAAKGEFESVVTWMRRRRETLTRYLNDAQFSVSPLDSGSLVTVYGQVGVRVESEGYSEVLYPGRAASKVKTAGSLVDSTEARAPAPLEYQIPLPPDQLKFYNAVRGNPIGPSGEIPSPAPVLTFHPTSLSQPRSEDVTLGPGLVEVKADLYVQAPASLTVKPGTDLRLGQGVSIVSTGPVLMLGTEQKLITVRASSDRPWGSFSLVGRGTDRSRLSYVHMEGGSEANFRGTRFKGMLNVYSCPDLKVKHCRFGANNISDDAVNLADSHFLVEDCVWKGARSDGLDSDMSQGVIRRTRFEDSGNDGLDLMTSKILVQDCEFVNCGDKGLSVGENSRALVMNSQFRRCQIGSQVKDDSRAYFQDCSFTDNAQTLDAYRKKWLYTSGGHLLVDRCRLEQKKGALLVLDKRSTAQSVDTDLESSDPGYQVLEKVDDEWREMRESLQNLGL
jgi:Right handed beta helix region/CotH kinase protein